MSEFNFDNMKNVDIPDSWVDGALNIPPENKTPIPFLKYSKIIAFASSIVLVCSISVALFFITNSSVAVPSVKNTETECSTISQTNSQNVVNTENVTEKNEQKDNTDATEVETETDSQAEEETIEPTENQNPTEKEKPDSDVVKPDSGKPKPTENKEKPNKPTKPIPTEKPTESFTGDSPPEDSPPDYEELSYISGFSNRRITAEIHFSDFSSSVYCRIYDSKGHLVGDNDLYSSKREAIQSDKISSESSEYFSYDYNVDNLGEILEKGNYEVVFYNEIGYFLCTGFITIS